MTDAVCLWVGRVVVYGVGACLAVAIVGFALLGAVFCFAWGRGTR